jgi:hypothetical protein
MEARKPAKKFSFTQGYQIIDGRNQLEIQGSSSPPSNYYTIGGRQIVTMYNSSRYPRGPAELMRMGQLNEVYWTGTSRQLAEIIDDIGKEFRRNAIKMWDDIFGAYRSAKGSLPRKVARSRKSGEN